MKQLFFLLFASLALTQASATHNRAGEITYEQIGATTIRMTITTYTKLSGQSIHADRSQLDVDWGDGIIETVSRSNYVDILADVRRSQYVAEHTYPGATIAGVPYILSMQDPNRNENILNINGANSINVAFYLQTEVFLTTTYYNSSPVCLVPPIDVGVVGQLYQHTPNANDPDGDSIAYELITPQSDRGVNVPSYVLPDAIAAGANNQLTMDALTGIITWNAPQQVGEYNIAYLVKSYRDGVYMGAVVRDMQILIFSDSLDTLPQIEIITPELVELQSTQSGTVQMDFVVRKHSSLNLDLEFFAWATVTPTILAQSPDSVKVRYEWTPTFDSLSPFAQHHYVSIRAAYAYTNNFMNESKGVGIYKPVRIVYRGAYLGLEKTSEAPPIVSIYPNPSSNILNIRYVESSEKTTLTIISLDGKQLHQETLAAHTTTAQISIKQLPKGAYILHLNNARWNSSQQFLKIE